MLKKGRTEKMSYFIIIRGPLGVGKSTIAKKVAQILNAEYISMDSVLDKYGLDKIEGECIPVENFLKAHEIFLPEVKRKLEEGIRIVLDGNFYHKQQVEHLIQNISFPFYVFTLKASLETCIDRDKKREHPYGKDATIAVYTLVSRFDYGKIIDTDNKTEEEVIKEVFSYLPEK
jgi:tRNA uridine 5-carbamoylmethylation protein Kti12